MAESDRGALALVLHSHMPYVEGFGTWPFGEEWLLEAMASVYVPLIELCEKWADAGRGDVLSLGLTPVLCDQLEAADLDRRFSTYCTDVRMKLSSDQALEYERKGETEMAGALSRITDDYVRSLRLFESLDKRLLPAFRQLQDRGVVTLWTSTATHATLPLVATEAGRRLQLDTGIRSHRRRFGGWSGGFWLPECAYEPGLERLMFENGVDSFCVDQTGKGERLDTLEPVHTPAGPIAVPVDWPTVELVWSDGGYPAHSEYRDYHAHSMHGMRPFKNGGGVYQAEHTVPVVQQHARDFVSKVVSLLDDYRNERDRPGLVTCALDTELLGHWWYEGLAWLEAVVDVASEVGLRLTVLPDGLADFKAVERELHGSSWGQGKDLSTWDCPRTADLVWAAREAEIKLIGKLSAQQQVVAGGNGRDLPADGAALRASRELLAIQSSDWGFMESRELAADYPRERVRSHRREFERALSRIGAEHDGTESLIEAQLRSLAPDVDLGSLFHPPTATLAT